MQVKDIMQTKVISVTRGTNLAQLLGLFKDFHSFPVVPVVDENQVLIGIVRMRNLFDVFKPHHQEILMRNPLSMLSHEPTDIFDIDIEEGMGFLVIVADIMDQKIVKVKESQSLKDAYDLMQLHSRDAIPVVNAEKQLVGIISIFDILMQIFREKGVA
ncbi:MAG: CBS domain-containing protein [PVC group bacterium]|nr:CBS domain-containing protein [PVC group bacterium]